MNPNFDPTLQYEGERGPEAYSPKCYLEKSVVEARGPMREVPKIHTLIMTATSKLGCGCLKGYCIGSSSRWRGTARGARIPREPAGIPPGQGGARRDSRYLCASGEPVLSVSALRAIVSVIYCPSATAPPTGIQVRRTKEQLTAS